MKWDDVRDESIPDLVDFFFVRVSLDYEIFSAAASEYYGDVRLQQIQKHGIDVEGL